MNEDVIKYATIYVTGSGDRLLCQVAKNRSKGKGNTGSAVWIGGVLPPPSFVELCGRVRKALACKAKGLGFDPQLRRKKKRIYFSAPQ